MASGTVISRGRGRGRGFGKGWVKDFRPAPCPVQPEEVGESLMFTREYHWLSCGVDFITTAQLHSKVFKSFSKKKKKKKVLGLVLNESSYFLSAQIPYLGKFWFFNYNINQNALNQ